MFNKLFFPKKKIILLLLPLVVFAGVYIYYQHLQTVAVARNAHELILSGNVDVREVSLAFRENDRIIQLLADEGDNVKKGQLLGRLDNNELLLQIAKTKAQIKTQEAAVLRLKNGSRAEVIAQAAAKADSARADNDYAAQDLAKKEAAFKDSQGLSVSQQDIDAAQAKYHMTKATVAETAAAYKLAAAGPRFEDIMQAQNQLAALKDELSRQEYILSQYDLKSPCDGVIRSRLLESGDMASPQKPVFQIALNNKKWLRVYVKETDLGRIHEGQKALVYIDSYPQKPIKGQIGYISSTAEFTPKTVQTDELRTSLLYQVKVYVNDTDNILRMGMPATVKISL